jgi:hypothetical protein
MPKFISANTASNFDLEGLAQSHTFETYAVAVILLMTAVAVVPTIIRKFF